MVTLAFPPKSTESYALTCARGLGSAKLQYVPQHRQKYHYGMGADAWFEYELSLPLESTAVVT